MRKAQVVADDNGLDSSSTRVRRPPAWLSPYVRAAERGISTEQIATQLSLSPATVRNYLSNAISKVHANNRIDAIRLARKRGLALTGSPAAGSDRRRGFPVRPVRESPRRRGG